MVASDEMESQQMIAAERRAHFAKRLSLQTQLITHTQVHKPHCQSLLVSSIGREKLHDVDRDFELNTDIYIFSRLLRCHSWRSRKVAMVVVVCEQHLYASHMHVRMQDDGSGLQVAS